MVLEVLYEDNHLIAVYKPAGILVQADKSGDKTLMYEVKEYLKEKYKKPGNVFLGLIHRLDRPVSGIILFAKTTKGASRLSEQFREHTVEKIYTALVVGVLPSATGTVVHYLVKDENKNKTTVHDMPVAEGKRADLTYKVLQTNKKYSLVTVKLGTGRSHQIRAQLAAIGTPIVGDLKYGAKTPMPDQSIALAATSLAFDLATQEERVVVTAPTPATWQAYLA